jgi:hypothetical protein
LLVFINCFCLSSLLFFWCMLSFWCLHLSSFFGLVYFCFFIESCRFEARPFHTFLVSLHFLLSWYLLLFWCLSLSTVFGFLFSFFDCCCCFETCFFQLFLISLVFWWILCFWWLSWLCIFVFVVFSPFLIDVIVLMLFFLIRFSLGCLVSFFCGISLFCYLPFSTVLSFVPFSYFLIDVVFLMLVFVNLFGSVYFSFFDGNCLCQRFLAWFIFLILDVYSCFHLCLSQSSWLRSFLFIFWWMLSF